MKQGLSAVLLVGALALAGCGGGDSQATAEAAPLSQTTVEITTAAPAATEAVTTVVVTDAAAAASDTAAAADAAGAPAAGQPGPGNGAPAGAGPGVMGEITAVDGSTLTVQDQRQQTTVSVLLTGDTQITAQVAVDLANIAVGETVTAMGSQEGDVFTAMRVQVGEAGGPGGGPGGMTPPDGQQPPSDMTPPADGQQPPSDAGSAGGPPAGGMSGAVISGTVTAAADGLTITTADGATVQVVLAPDGQATQQAQTTAANLAAGTQIMVQGESDGTAVTATSVQIMRMMRMQP